MSTRRVVIVTGTRAEFGLLHPVICAIDAHPRLEALVIAAGAHFLAPSRTVEEVRRGGFVAAEVPMQREGETGRLADAKALARGIEGFVDAFAQLSPDWVLVLGDRIEAFAGACAASVGGVALAHVHGGDRAEGVADEAMRHAITKLAHLHLAATSRSAERVNRMGEDEARIVVTGSPAAIGAERIEAKPLRVDARVIEPDAIILLHPCGSGHEAERRCACAALEALDGRCVLALHPNHDPDREGILDAIRSAAAADDRVIEVGHLDHDRFRGLLKWLGERGGVLVGNSSAGLIDAAILKCPAVDIGPRQAGREMPANVVHVDDEAPPCIRDAVERARKLDLSGLSHPYGDGRADQLITRALAEVDPHDPSLLRKRNTY